MALYSYQAFSKDGKKVKGILMQLLCKELRNNWCIKDYFLLLLNLQKIKAGKVGGKAYLVAKFHQR